MKKVIAVFGLSLMITGTSFAATTQEKSEELSRAIIGPLVETLFPIVIAPIVCSAVMTPSQEEEVKNEILSLYGPDTFVQQASPFFSQNYTEEELDQLINFYKSDVSKKMVALTPKFNQFMAEKMQHWQKEVYPKAVELGSKMAQKYPKRPQDQVQACIKSRTGQ